MLKKISKLLNFWRTTSKDIDYFLDFKFKGYYLNFMFEFVNSYVKLASCASVDHEDFNPLTSHKSVPTAH